MKKVHIQDDKEEDKENHAKLSSPKQNSFHPEKNLSLPVPELSRSISSPLSTTFGTDELNPPKRFDFSSSQADSSESSTSTASSSSVSSVTGKNVESVFMFSGSGSGAMTTTSPTTPQAAAKATAAAVSNNSRRRNALKPKRRIEADSDPQVLTPASKQLQRRPPVVRTDGFSIPALNNGDHIEGTTVAAASSSSSSALIQQQPTTARVHRDSGGNGGRSSGPPELAIIDTKGGGGSDYGGNTIGGRSSSPPELGITDTGGVEGEGGRGTSSMLTAGGTAGRVVGGFTSSLSVQDSVDEVAFFTDQLELGSDCVSTICTHIWLKSLWLLLWRELLDIQF